MRKLLLEENAIEDFEFWSKNNIKLLKKVAELFSAISKDPLQVIRKPEALKDDLKGYWSRRINEEHRIVYRVADDVILIISCRSHYKI